MSFRVFSIGIMGLPILVFTVASLFPGPSGVGESLPSPGEKIFRSKCSICHSVDGSGKTAMGKKQKVRDLRSPEVQHQPDSALEEIISKGKGKMPGYEKSLGRDKIREVVGHVRELGHRH